MDGTWFLNQEVLHFTIKTRLKHLMKLTLKGELKTIYVEVKERLKKNSYEILSTNIILLMTILLLAKFTLNGELLSFPLKIWGNHSACKSILYSIIKWLLKESKKNYKVKKTCFHCLVHILGHILAFHLSTIQRH